MRISELSNLSGVPLSAVKYYQREGLLPDGVRSAPNQVDYGDAHVRRVRLIRALIETGGLSIAATKNVIASLDTDSESLAETFSVAQNAMSTPRTAESRPSETSRQRVLALANSQGWAFLPQNPGIDGAARALDGLLAIGFDPPESYLAAYATAAATVAEADLRALDSRDGIDAVAELMVVGSVLGDPLFGGLRRLAHEDTTHTLRPTHDAK